MKRETTTIITTTLALTLLGVLMVYSATSLGDGTAGKLPRQLIYATLGLTVMFCAARFDYHRLKDPIIFRSIVAVSLGLLVLVLLPAFGVETNNARRWIAFGSFQFQPSEIAKFALILLLAVKLTDNRERIHLFSAGFIPPMLIAALFAGLVLAENDLGIPVIMIAVTYVMITVAGVRLRYLFASLLPVFVAIAMLVLWVPHRTRRIVGFLDPWADRLDTGFQLIQSMFAFSQGDLLGRGAGAGEQKLGYLLDAAHTDFIFAVLGEELGLVGTLTVVALFCGFLIAALRIAMNAQDEFGMLLATGITTIITLQAAFMMAVTTGLLPTKGLTLPFIAYGGSALIMTLAMAGVLINIGVQAVEPEPVRKLAKA
jgi:cell division protein FtsW